MNAVLTAKTTNDWVEVLEAVGVPCGPVYDYAQMFADRRCAAVDSCNMRAMRNWAKSRASARLSGSARG